MSRTPLPLFTGDVSDFARSLRGQLSSCDHTPGHVELLNMLARSAGYRNFQHFRAQCEAQNQLDAPPSPVAMVDTNLVLRAARYFDAKGSLTRWPGKFSHRGPCLWVIWSKIPPRQDMSEPEINARLNDAHLFEDHALLRRELFDRGMVSRTPDGRVYRRIERQPTPEALELIRRLSSLPAN
ncbi:MAG: DUF2087 domain-containing protein [Acidobacteriota bacterium]